MEQRLRRAVSLNIWQKGLLVCFGAGVGTLVFFGLYAGFPSLVSRITLPAGQQFENLEDLRRAISEPDSQDVTTTHGVTLRSLITPHPSDEIIYTLKPHLDVRFQDAQVLTNSHGMRNPETPTTKPRGVYRLAILGDSYAFGWGVEEADSFPRKLEHKLKQIHKETPAIEVLNFGVPGYGTGQEVASFFEKGAEFQPDAILVYFIFNDFALPFFIRDLASDDPMALAAAVDFTSMKIHPQDSLKLEKRKALLQLLESNRALLRLAQYCEKYEIKLFLALHPDSFEEATYQRLWVLKNSPGRELVVNVRLKPSFDEIVAVRGISQLELRQDADRHPSPLAHALIADLLAEKLSPMLFEKKLKARS